MENRPQFPIRHTAPEVEEITRIERVTSSTITEAYILSPKVHWVPFHWMGTFSVPHYEEPDPCEGCTALQSIQERGYLLVATSPSRKAFFLEFTAYSFREVRTWAEEQPTLRGLVIKYKKIRPSKNAPIYLEFGAAPPIDIQGRPDESPRRTLELLWMLRKNKHLRRVNG